MTPECRSCGLWTKCKSPQIEKETPSQEVDILFVGDYPEEEDEYTGKPFSGSAGAFLRQFTSFIEAKVAYTYALKCRLSKDDKKDEAGIKTWTNHCQEFLKEDVQQLRPKIIVALGSLALKAVWPDGPKSIAQARVAPRKVGNTWIVATYHPINHITGRRDLRQDYFSLGQLLGRILSGTYTTETPDIREATDETMPQVTSQIINSKYFFFDVETDTWGYKSHPEIKTFYMPGRSMICIGFGTSEEEPVWVLRPHHFDQVKHLLRHKVLVAHNILYDASVLHYLCGMDWVWGCEMEDTFLMHVSMDQGYIGNSLDDLSMKYLSVSSWKEEAHNALLYENAARRAYGDPSNHPVTFADIPWNTLVAYNGRDVYYTIKLYNLFKGFDLPQSYKDRYMGLVPLLGRTQVRGIRARKEKILATKEVYERKIDFLSKSLMRAPEIRKVCEESGVSEFNPSSGLQMTRLMMELDIDPGFSESGKYYKTDKKTMAEIVPENSLMRRVVRIKEMRNMLSKFITPLSFHVANDGRVHTSYTLGRAESTFSIGSDPTGGVTTGRISARDPALHNFKKDPILRACFEPPEGWTCVELDYGAAEVRGLAWIADCKNLIEWFTKNIDPYIMVMATMDNVPYERMFTEYKFGAGKVKLKARRQQTKGGFLGWQYGSGLLKFAQTIGADMKTAERLYSVFDELFPEVRVYQERELQTVRDGLPIVTSWGLQRRFSIDSPHDENAIKNFRIQSTMSDVTLHAAKEMEITLPSNEFQIVNLVHDSVWADVRDEVLPVILKKAVDIMRKPSLVPFEITVPLEVEVQIGKNRGQMKEFALAS
jgi:uracil-DNA glycosylase family 4